MWFDPVHKDRSVLLYGSVDDHCARGSDQRQEDIGIVARDRERHLIAWAVPDHGRAPLVERFDLLGRRPMIRLPMIDSPREMVEREAPPTRFVHSRSGVANCVSASQEVVSTDQVVGRDTALYLLAHGPSPLPVLRIVTYLNGAGCESRHWVLSDLVTSRFPAVEPQAVNQTGEGRPAEEATDPGESPLPHERQATGLRGGSMFPRHRRLATTPGEAPSAAGRDASPAGTSYRHSLATTPGEAPEVSAEDASPGDTTDHRSPATTQAVVAR